MLATETLQVLLGGTDDREVIHIGGDLADLAGAVARAGDHSSAEALARANPEPGAGARALTAVAAAVVRSGDHRHGLELATEAQQMARAVRSPVHQQVELAALAGLVARSGDLEWALAIAGTVHDPARDVVARTAVARAAAEAGDYDIAEATAHSIGSKSARDTALAVVVEAAARAGDTVRAVEINHTIETDNRSRAVAFGALAGAAEAAGDYDGAATVMDPNVERIAEAGDQADESIVLALTEAVARTGGIEHSERVARMIADAAPRARALVAVARAAAERGRPSRATALVDEAEAVARSIGGPGDRPRTLAELVETITIAGDGQSVIVVIGDPGTAAQSIDGTSERTRIQAMVIEAIARTGDHERAAAAATELAGALDEADSHGNWELLAALARAAAETGHPERAEQLVNRITHPEIQATTLAHLANAADPARARRLIARAFAIDLWTAVGVLRRLEPSVLLLLAEDLAVADLRPAPPAEESYFLAENINLW
ncbi:hypothetical protein EST92_22330 [Streptomyces sp. TM32]|uniref:hypothetical protein n=1 Tax=Streptomyces sp. TM32 TaxID=1652669 RepID=UPI0010131CB8|nr:hypothetical protein [Streptomyces sp. TM32]RXS73188.1 hypothetical protein EST92_22330 [Streptomyces sp. TM32]